MSTKENYEQINFCQNCGKEVEDRTKTCSCGRLPYYYDNEDIGWNMNEVVKMDEKQFEEFLKIDSEKERKYKILYCMKCGFNHNDDIKYTEVDEETGEVFVKCPKCNYEGRL